MKWMLLGVQIFKKKAVVLGEAQNENDYVSWFHLFLLNLVLVFGAL